ncbi:lipopolysaccharide transport system ATP-binding protein [Pseudoxanthomonas sp. CF385]|uniref:ABC transporter ATP-binding protein n=1 Tax=Pseudoxanthomonas sp. CF385 TaxID=1881042 RepID=UPI00088E8159|nr:ABC transporter ATP-binding protein [Pseudoxanthomonas sp. CF385]SDQ37253.1 lipopolysaccharide transport system ATP-binding protein [Pseudoxanthomonas sp. CF385]
MSESLPASAFTPAISVRGLVKDYTLYRSPAQRLLALFWPRLVNAKRFRALDEVSFEVPRGHTMGVIGRNGAGKSTLLQILCGTVTPSSGEIRIDGRFAALLELGAGFNPEFDGRQNIYLNASLLGLSHDQVNERLTDIIEFSGIGEFIDRPVKTYSSGMYVRLAFAVAVHTQPEILIVDEALAVGDIRFQMKCLEKIEQLRAGGTTILFVSHSLEQVKRFCQTAIWLEAGKVKLHGDANFVTDCFRDHEMSVSPSQSEPTGSSIDTHGLGLHPARINEVRVSREHLAPFDDLTVDVHYEVLDESVPGLLLGVAIKSPDGAHIFGPNTHLERVAIPTEQGRHHVSYHIPAFPLLSGSYRIDAGIFTDKGLVCLDYLSDVKRVVVASPYFSEGVVYIQHEWRVHGK